MLVTTKLRYERSVMYFDVFWLIFSVSVVSFALFRISVLSGFLVQLREALLCRDLKRRAT